MDKLGYLGLVLIITEDGSLQQFVKVEPELSNQFLSSILVKWASNMPMSLDVFKPVKAYASIEVSRLFIENF